MSDQFIEIEYEGTKDSIDKKTLKIFYNKLNQGVKKIPEYNFEKFYAFAEKYFPPPINLWGIDFDTFELYDEINLCSKHDQPVLILGETGTGKELVAKAIHKLRHLNDVKFNKFIAINCAGIPETLLESELFGIKKGTATTVDKSRDGLIKLADNGTLFLDEIGDMPPSMQAKILRAVEDKEIRPLGAKKEEPVNFRLICATNADISDPKVRKEKPFRSDLYFRINRREIKLRPLSESIENSHFVIYLYLKLLLQKYEVPFKLSTISEKDLYIYYKHTWEGHYRELITELENTVIKAKYISEGRLLKPSGRKLTQVKLNGATEYIPRTIHVNNLYKVSPTDIIKKFQNVDLIYKNKGISKIDESTIKAHSTNSEQTKNDNYNIINLINQGYKWEDIEKLFISKAWELKGPGCKFQFKALGELLGYEERKMKNQLKKYGIKSPGNDKK